MTGKQRAAQLGISALLFIVAILSLGGSINTSRGLKESNDALKAYVQCQSQWTGFLYVSLTRARDADSSATQALDDLIQAVTQAKSADETRAALANYNIARENQKKVVTDNPLPPPPEEVCEV